MTAEGSQERFAKQEGSALLIIFDGGEKCFCIDSELIEVYRMAREKRCKMCKINYSKAPSFGYFASQNTYY